MSQKYQIFEEWPESEWQAIADCSLFIRKSYWQVHLSNSQMLPVSVFNNGALSAFICFAKIENQISTPYKAPYLRPFIKTGESLEDILVLIIQYLKLKNPQSVIRINLAEAIKSKDIIDSTLCQISTIDISHAIIVSKIISFTTYIGKNGADRKKRKLQQLLKQHYTLQSVDAEAYHLNYELLVKWRNLKGHQDMISPTEMHKLKERFPENYKMLKLSHHTEIVGLAVIVKECSNCYYVYILLKKPEEQEDLNLLLWNGIYEMARSENIRTIEMGTSMLPNGRINRGLARYKTAIGGKTTRKYTLQCLLN